MIYLVVVFWAFILLVVLSFLELWLLSDVNLRRFCHYYLKYCICSFLLSLSSCILITCMLLTPFVVISWFLDSLFISFFKLFFFLYFRFGNFYHRIFKFSDSLLSLLMNPQAFFIFVPVFDLYLAFFKLLFRIFLLILSICSCMLSAFFQFTSLMYFFLKILI